MIQAISFLEQGSHLALEKQGLVKGSFFWHLLSPSFHQAEVKKVVEIAKQRLEQPQNLSFAEALIHRYRYDKSVKNLIIDFDRHVAPYREQLAYLCPETQKSLQKWLLADQPPEIFRDHPKFVQFLKTSTLLSQIKITRDQVQLIDGEPALFVNGNWVKENDLYERFEVVYSKLYGQKFVVEKKTREIYTYLDNGQGLQPHHPFHKITPISKLDKADYLRVLESAHKFVRPEGDEERPFILQVVSSYIHEGNSNCFRFLYNAKHPYLRLIIGKDNPEFNTRQGEVYEVGYFPKVACFPPLQATQGRFRAPDAWEYKTPDERIVTNIALSQQEAHNFYNFTMKYHLDGVNLGIEPGFHFAEQNCCVYLREACAAAGIAVPTEASIPETLRRSLPDWIQKVGRQLSMWNQSVCSKISSITHCFLPQCLIDGTHWIGRRICQIVGRIFEAIVAFSILPYRALLGEFRGNGGAAFRQQKSQPAHISPPLRNWRNLFKFPKLNLLSVVQEWQLAQPSTVRYKNNPVKLAIVP